MPNHRVKLIVNPNAFRGKAWRAAGDLRPLVDSLGGGDWAGTVYPTHAVELAQQAGEEGYDLVVALGGDGTVHEVVNGLMRLPDARRPRLGVVPLGSGNDFANLIGMQPRAELAMRQVFTGRPSRVDVIRLQDDSGRTEYVDNTVGIGFDGTVTIRSRQVALLQGFMLYLTAVLQTILLNHEVMHLQIQTDEEHWQEEALMLTLCNGRREGGGFNVAPKADPTDGVLEYVRVSRVSQLMMLRLLPEFMRGTHEGFAPVKTGRFRQMELISDRPLYIHTDGEIFAGFGMQVRRVSAEVLPAALEVVV